MTHDTATLSLRQIILALFSITLVMLALSTTVSMHYIFSTSISDHMEKMWQQQANTMAEQARFSIITESETDIKKIIQLFDNPLTLAVRVYTKNKLLYATGNSFLSCDKNKITDTYWCLLSTVEDKNNAHVIGKIQLLISKKEIQRLIDDNLFNVIIVISFLTLLVYGFVRYQTDKLVKPIASFSSVMKRVGMNERGLRVNVEGPLDIQNLQISFNKMINEIERYESHLEEMVKERTIELTESYKKAQGASKVKTDILKIVSHEMKTPLHNAIFYLHLMELNKGHFVPEILEHMEQLQSQILNLLDYAGAVDDKIKLNNTRFSPSTLLELIVNEQRPIIDFRENELATQIDYHENIFSDRQLIKQIINNLLSNANKFTHHGKITLRCYTSDNHLLISVEDTGCGISENNLSKIFNPFWQVDMSSARHHEGTGLGLSICQLFAETIKGQITVESTLNKGSLFTFSIPIKSKIDNTSY